MIVREPLDVSRSWSGTTAYSVAWQVLHVLGMAPSCEGDEFERELTASTGSAGRCDADRMTLYLHERGLQSLTVDLWDWERACVFESGYDYTRDVVQAEAGPGALDAWSWERYVGYVAEYGAFRRRVDVSRAVTRVGIATNDEVVELVSTGHVVAVTANAIVTPDAQVVTNTFLLYRRDSAGLHVYDPLPLTRTTLMTVRDIRVLGEPVRLDAFRTPG